LPVLELAQQFTLGDAGTGELQRDRHALEADELATDHEGGRGGVLGNLRDDRQVVGPEPVRDLLPQGIGDVQIEASPGLIGDGVDNEHPIACERGTWFERYAGM